MAILYSYTYINVFTVERASGSILCYKYLSAPLSLTSVQILLVAISSMPKTRSNRRKRDAKNASSIEGVDGPEWFFTNALKAGDILRKLHPKADARRLDFVYSLDEFIASEPPEDYLHGLYEGRLLHVLMDIALERSLYKEYVVDEDAAVSGQFSLQNPVGEAYISYGRTISN